MRKAHFLGQNSVESRDYTSMVEDNNDGTPVSGERYEGRADFGNTHRGDGARYIGRDVLQLTRRDIYDRVGTKVDRWHQAHDDVAQTESASPMCLTESIDLVDHPERPSAFPGAIETACAFWLNHNINHYADQDSVLLVTQAISGGLLNLSERVARTEKAKRLLAAPTDTELQRGLRGVAKEDAQQ